MALGIIFRDSKEYTENILIHEINEIVHGLPPTFTCPSAASLIAIPVLIATQPFLPLFSWTELQRLVK